MNRIRQAVETTSLFTILVIFLLLLVTTLWLIDRAVPDLLAGLLLLSFGYLLGTKRVEAVALREDSVQPVYIPPKPDVP